MKITSRILNIPPYLSTTWSNVAALHVRTEGNLLILVVSLQNQTQIEIPNLTKETIAEIFEAHTRSQQDEPTLPLDSPFSFSLPLSSAGNPFEHNPAQVNLPILQPELLKKIIQVSKAFGLEDSNLLSNPIEGCNCMHCQMTRAMNEEKELEEITQEDLHFRDWEIAQEENQLYTVTNPLDENEVYKVFLGTPLGCTCGAKNCEHIRAVLKT